MPPERSPRQIRPVDKPQSSVTKLILITVDKLQKDFESQSVECITPLLKECFKPNFYLSTLARGPTTDIDEVTTIDKYKICTISVPLPPTMVMCLILTLAMVTSQAYGGGGQYALFVVDRGTRYKYICPITSLKHDILLVLHHHITELDCSPRKMVTNFDQNFIGKAMADHLHSINCKLESMPPRL